MKLGDFTGLASDYSRYRPNYSRSVLKAATGLFDKPTSQIDFVDVGAGTGIWTRMVAELGVRSVTAIEPNEDMRQLGMVDTQKYAVKWMAGSAEKTGLPDSSADWVTMASSFHWADFNLAVREFHRILRPGGRFMALWNPRLIETNPALVQIEKQLSVLQPGIKRVSSGRSNFAESLTDRLWDCGKFTDVVYLEGRHTITMSVERYLGAWRSVNDLPSQLGVDKFQSFLEFVERRLKGVSYVQADYLTRAWSALREGSAT